MCAPGEIAPAVALLTAEDREGSGVHEGGRRGQAQGEGEGEAALVGLFHAADGRGLRDAALVGRLHGHAAARSSSPPQSPTEGLKLRC